MMAPAHRGLADRHAMLLFLCGDVMTGRGIDQILPRPGDPRIFESFARSALDYVDLAQQASGPLLRPVGFDYIWGDALAVLEREHPDARIANLETAVTTSSRAWPGKAVCYRMHPGNVPCLTAARIDCCVLANNHVLDWGRAGLEDTLESLRRAAIRTAGAGRDETAAAAPAILPLARGARLLVYGVALSSSGVPAGWRATRRLSGVNWLEDASAQGAELLAERIAADRRPGDRTVVSIHWGGNWGYAVSPGERQFAHRLIDTGQADLIHGHSSHHPRGAEVYRRRLILYGCGDFLNDYEGIGGHEPFRPDLTLMYFPVLDAESGELAQLTLVPMRIHRFRIEAAREHDAAWLEQTMDRECAPWGSRVRRLGDGSLTLDWTNPSPPRSNRSGQAIGHRR